MDENVAVATVLVFGGYFLITFLESYHYRKVSEAKQAGKDSERSLYCEHCELYAVPEHECLPFCFQCEYRLPRVHECSVYCEACMCKHRPSSSPHICKVLAPAVAPLPFCPTCQTIRPTEHECFSFCNDCSALRPAEHSYCVSLAS